MDGEVIVMFNMKVDETLKDRFLRIAKINESDGAKEVRKFMKKYVADNAHLALKLS